MDRIERWLTRRNATFTLVLIALLTVLFGVSLFSVKLDHDFENFFPTDDPELDRYEAFRKRFGNDNDFLLVVLERQPTVFHLGTLVRFDSLGQRLARLPDVVSMTSPTRLAEPIVTPVGAFEVPFLRLDHDSTLAADSARIWKDPRVRGNFFSADAEVMMMVVLTAPGLSKERSDALLEGVEEQVRVSGLQQVRLAGRIHGQYYYIAKMLKELITFLLVSLVLLTIFLAIAFRSAWGVAVPIGVVGLTVLWQVGLMALVGKPLSILTMLLPTILFVVGMSDVVHIVERYVEALRLGHPKRRALAITYYEVGLATFLTSITTAIGFGTLITSSIGPIREFGLFTSLGVMLAFALAFTLLPAVLLLTKTPVIADRAERSHHWTALMSTLFRFTLRNRKGILWGTGVLMVLSLLAVDRIKVNNFLLEDWPDDDPQKQDYYFVERKLGGVRPFELEVQVLAPGGNVWHLEELRQMERVQDHLEKDYGVQGILSPVTVMRSLNQAFHGGDASYYRLPDDAEEAARMERRLSLVAGKDMLATLVTPDQRTTRMSGRMTDEGGYVHKRKNAVLDAFIQENTDAGLLGFNQTGMAFLIDRNNEKLSAQMLGGLTIAFVLVAGIMAAVFRNWRMTVIALLPNVVPLLVVGGIMGLSGIDLKVSTAIIFTIAFGIAVDDTIHLLGKLRIELAKGRSLPYAMKRAYLSAGKAVIITSIMLCSGFISLVFSDFASVFYMGLLVSLTLAMALLADLLLLPVLVLLFMRPAVKVAAH